MSAVCFWRQRCAWDSCVVEGRLVAAEGFWAALLRGTGLEMWVGETSGWLRP
jgi:hypothetical protein